MMVGNWMHVVVISWVHSTVADLGGSVFMARGSVGTAVHQLSHESDVGNRQPQRLNARESLLVRKCWHFPTEFIESFVQVEHPSSLTNIGRPSLGN